MKKIISLLICVLFLTGCQTVLKQSTFNKILCGASKGSNSKFSYNLCNKISAVTYASLSKLLTPKEQKSFYTKTSTALEEAKDGQKIKWKSPNTNSYAEITTSNTQRKQKSIKIIKAKNISTPPELDLIGKKYRATTNVNIRDKPSIISKSVGALMPNQEINVIGKVRGKNWYLIDRRGVASGYVSGQYLSANSEEIKSVLVNKKIEEPIINNNNVEEVKVIAITTCRDVNSKITNNDGKIEQLKYEACKSRIGVWEVL